MSMMKRHLKCMIVLLLLFIVPFLTLFTAEIDSLHIYKNPFLYGKHYSANQFNSTSEYTERVAIFINSSKVSNGLYAQATRVYLNMTVNNETVNDKIDKINRREDTSDFAMNGLLRMMYLDKDKNNITVNLKNRIKEAILNFKYWFTEPNDDDMIFWTENHMILFHTAELLAGQLYPNENFPNSNMNGTDHINHAIPLINQWLNWKGQLGFAEWHSNIYYRLELTALLNLVDYAEDNDIATKAAMLVDLIAFDFACNYYQGIYATAHGRTEDHKQLGTSRLDPPNRESTSEAAWLLLNIGYHRENDGDNSAAVFLATSEKYNPPPILENIATASKNAIEHKSRNNIGLYEGSGYGIGYSNLNDLMFWWGMSAPAASPIIEKSFDTIDQYDLQDELVFNDPDFDDLFEIAALIQGVSLSEVADLVKDVTQGVCLEAVNTYTYRTPYYQLSGAQDHQKGMNGLQEHIWQASLDDNATIYTSSPGGVSPQEFTGGWKPRATLYKDVGIIQYDRKMQQLILELVFLYLGDKPYTHAYFPRWAFEEIRWNDHWTFGLRNNAYVALYSYEPTIWENDYELRANGKKNVWIVELGSQAEDGSFDAFVNNILAAPLEIQHLPIGFNVRYTSPSQGLIEVGWNAPMYVQSQKVDIGPYPRFNNSYCNQQFGTNITLIEFGDESLELDFNLGNRTYLNS